MTTVVWIKTFFEGFHRWADAPDDVAFLRSFHRHVFHVKVGVLVNHKDREVEFFQLKRKVDAFITKEYAGKSFLSSCEHIASVLLERFDAYFVEVSEDGENGSFVTSERKPVSLQRKTKCFVGYEAEGPNRNQRLLFVPGSTPLEGVRKAISCTSGMNPSIVGAYYGAGNDRAFCLETLKELYVSFPYNRITVEVEKITDVVKLWVGDLPVLLVSNDPDNESEATFIKEVYEGKNVVLWRGKTGVFANRLDDPLYDLDQDVG